MTTRLSANHVASRAINEWEAEVVVLATGKVSRAVLDSFTVAAVSMSVMDALKEAGYAVVHPDDVPQLTRNSLHGAQAAAGWNACRESIFGEDA